MDINKFSVKGRLKNKSIINISSLSSEDISEILYMAKLYKNKLAAKETHNFLNGKLIAVVLSEISSVKNLSFDIAIRQAGGHSIYLSTDDMDIGDDNIIDMSFIVKSFGLDAIVIYDINQNNIEIFEKNTVLPVINGLSQISNPCQALADLMTIWEKKGKLNGLKLAYTGPSTSNSDSLLIAAVKCGINVNFACPKGYAPDVSVLEKAAQYGEFTITENPYEAIKNADIVYSDNWANSKKKINDKDIFLPFKVTEELFKKADPEAIYMNPLPATRGINVDKEIVNGKNSVIYQQAENKLHIQKAALALLVK